MRTTYSESFDISARKRAVAKGRMAVVSMESVGRRQTDGGWRTLNDMSISEEVSCNADDIIIL